MQAESFILRRNLNSLVHWPKVDSPHPPIPLRMCEIFKYAKEEYNRHVQSILFLLTFVLDETSGT